MDFEIIDFHTHPYTRLEQMLGSHREFIKNSPEDFGKELLRAGITRFAGSVISTLKEPDYLKICNDSVLALKEYYKDSYIPGFTVDARYVSESIEQIDRAMSNGINLIGELVPYHYSWKYSDEGFEQILKYADGKNLIFSLHTNSDELETMGALAKRHPDVTFVFAHPGEVNQILGHIEIMKNTDNVYLDLSGTGLFRYGMLKRLVSELSAHRIIFGTDYPICNPGMYVAGVQYEELSDEEKRLIFSENAKRILKLK